ncbi:PTS sugar transporter subunit IIA [Fusobacterium sp.]|uniref:PTS sugar transporter subunit IIA n=1 Tax=Fusobacterium sp. TaxID=68766 RepID=UPI00260A05AA|nr:PTS sugar transporter subunit IIA [Fusobacterium sp.]
MLKDMLKENIRILDSVDNWQKAIEIAAKPLLEKNKIQLTYIDAMIKNIKKFGEYIIIAPNVAMPHSRPEDGVNENCLALLKLDKGVAFDNGEEVQIFFILGAKDNNSHINTLTELMEIVDDEEKIEELSKALTVDEIINLI